MKRFFKAIGRGLKRAAKAVVEFIEKCIDTVVDAMTAAAPPLLAVSADDSLAHAGEKVAEKIFTEKFRGGVGVKVKAAAAKAASLAKALKAAKIATALTKVATATSIAAGTAFLGGVVVVGFVGLIWLAKRIAKRLGGDKPWKAVENAGKAEQVVAMVGQFAA